MELHTIGIDLGKTVFHLVRLADTTGGLIGLVNTCAFRVWGIVLRQVGFGCAEPSLPGDRTSRWATGSPLVRVFRHPDRLVG
jgi:hypothetical protein